MNIEGPTSLPHHLVPEHQPAPIPSLRISAGVVTLVLSISGLTMAAARLFTKGLGGSTPFNGWMNFILIVGAVGSLVTGIVIIAKQRKTFGATPWLVGSFTALVLIACLGLLPAPGLPGLTLITLPVALAALVLAALVIAMERSRR